MFEKRLLFRRKSLKATGGKPLRRHYLVNKNLQLRLIFFSVMYTAVTLFAVVASMIIPEIITLRQTDRESLHAWQSANEILFVHDRIVPVLAFSLFAVALHSFWVSHKIAGPLVRLTNLYRAIRRGRIPAPKRLRKADLLHPEMGVFNEMTEGLRSKVERLNDRDREFQAALRNLESNQALDATSLDELKAQAQRMSEVVREFEVEVDDEAPDSNEDDQPPTLRGGFTLAELIIAVAILAILVSIALPNYGSAVHQARVTKAAGELRHIRAELEMYRNANGHYPSDDQNGNIGGTKVDIGTLLRGRPYIDPWGQPYEYLNISEQMGMRDVRKDMNLIPINTYYDLYSRGPDGESEPPISRPVSRDDILVANDGDFIGIAEDY